MVTALAVAFLSPFLVLGSVVRRGCVLMLLIVASFLKGNSGTMVGICTKNSGQYILDGTDIGQPAASYTRAKFVYEQVTPPPPSENDEG